MFTEQAKQQIDSAILAIDTALGLCLDEPIDEPTAIEYVTAGAIAICLMAVGACVAVGFLG
jgi:hypothetical protein